MKKYPGKCLEYIRENRMQIQRSHCGQHTQAEERFHVGSVIQFNNEKILIYPSSSFRLKHMQQLCTLYVACVITAPVRQEESALGSQRNNFRSCCGVLGL